jgi:3-deoxy-D-manno-octulosonate 8-phosphate phosphatase KdsC-like HAD superfamily phosphatase
MLVASFRCEPGISAPIGVDNMDMEFVGVLAAVNDAISLGRPARTYVIRAAGGEAELAGAVCVHHEYLRPTQTVGDEGESASVR